MPKISIIVPVYNVERFLARCLDSVLRQTYRDFEIICVNDGSTDNSLGILELYQKKDKRLYILNQENQGSSVARNNGLKLASGEFVYFLDSDDAIHPQCMEVVLGIAEKYSAELVCFQYENCVLRNVDDNKFFEKKIACTEADFTISSAPLRFMFIKNEKRIHYNVWTKFYRKSLLKDINFIEGVQFEDYPHTLEVLAKHPKTIVIREVLYLYTINPNSITNQRCNLKQIEDHHASVAYVYNIYSKNGDKKDIELLKDKFIPDILKQQLIRCRNADRSVKNLMYAELKKEFEELNSRRMLNWMDRRVLKCFLYCYFLKL